MSSAKDSKFESSPVSIITITIAIPEREQMREYRKKRYEKSPDKQEMDK